MGTLPPHDLSLTEIPAGTRFNLRSGRYPYELEKPVKVWMCRWCKKTLPVAHNRSGKRAPRCHVTLAQRMRIIERERVQGLEYAEGRG